MNFCKIESCPNAVHRRGLCSPHYSYHRYHGTIEEVAPKAYRHWLSHVNAEDRTATCSVCGFTKIYSNGKDGKGNPSFKCAAKNIVKPYVYTFGDGDIIPTEEAETARIRFYKEQDGLCAICERPESAAGTLCLDHCHTTGEIRGLLCSGCNRGLGMFRDSPDNLKAASEYLTR